MNRIVATCVLTGLTIATAPLSAQTPATQTPPPARGVQARQPFQKFTIEGEPVDRRKPELDTDHPVFAGQTRAPYHKTVDVAVTPIATGLEHDEFGHPTGSPKLHMQMTAKRRKKLQVLGSRLPTPKVYGPPEGNVLLVGWGSTQGPIQEAVDRARAAGDSVSSLHIKHLNPLPPGLDNVFSGFNHVLVVEMNDEGLYGYGQLGGLLRARYCDPKIRGITKTDGLTWKVREILDRAKANVAAGMRKL